MCVSSCTGGMGGFELHMHDWRLRPLAEHGTRKCSKGKHGQHWSSLVRRLDTPTGFRTEGILGEDFRNRVHQKAKSQSVLSPPPSEGHVDGHQQACQWWPGWTREQRPGVTDSRRFLKLDSNWRPAKPPTFMILLGGRRVSWHNLELSWQRVTG